MNSEDVVPPLAANMNAAFKKVRGAIGGAADPDLADLIVARIVELAKDIPGGGDPGERDGNEGQCPHPAHGSGISDFGEKLRAAEKDEKYATTVEIICQS